MQTYSDFLADKRQFGDGFGFSVDDLPEYLFEFQAMLVQWALRQGRAGIFADCGLGKTPMQLVWADFVHRRTGKPILIATPLAVSFQTELEAAKFGIDAAVSRNGSLKAPIVITNYERLHYFDADSFGGMICDESSALKAFDGKRRAFVTDFMRKMPYRLLCTATAAPNDYIELGTSSEALGYLGYMDMLSRFFTNDDKTSHPMSGRYGQGRHGPVSPWRFKGHAEEPFWRWVSSWARAIRKPSDFGYEDEGFILPALEHRQHVIKARTVRQGYLFDLPAVGLREESEEIRRTVQERCEVAAGLLDDADCAVAWCNRNDEGDLLTKLIPGAVQISGGDSAEVKEERLMAFTRGDIRVLVTKPKIGGWGLNWQHCHRMVFFPSHSYEQYYQAVRRSWRFGQKESVVVDIVTTEGSENTLKNLERKAHQAERMFDALVSYMNEAIHLQRGVDYNREVEVPQWLY